MSDVRAEPLLSVGALAGATGLTVRALHHWDAIGLLVPSERTGAGHRRYTDADVRRLYRIVALRSLGLGLDAIASALDGETDLREAIAEHLAGVERRIAAEQELRTRLVTLLESFDDARLGPPSSSEFLQTIEVMTMHEQYYTPDQLEALAARRDALGPEGMERVQQEWTDLIAAMKAEQEADTDPAHPRVQELAAKWQALIEAFTGGDPGTRENLERLYRDQGAQQASRGAMDEELSAYVQRAMAARG